MNDSNLLKLFIVITKVFFTAIFVLGIIYLSKTYLNSQQTQGNDGVELIQDLPFKQNITSNQQDLDLVLIHFKNPQVSNKDPLQLNLLDQSGSVLRSLSISGSNVGNDDWVRFQFAPIAGSKDQVYELYILSNTASNKPKIQVITDKGRLSYKAYSKIAIPVTLLNSLQNFGQRFAIDLPFDILYTVLLAAPIAIYCLRRNYH